jgi:hypothetical protein
MVIMLIVATSLQLGDLFAALLRQHDPFAAAPRLCARAFGARDGEWRRYAADHGFVELGPFERGTPRKIVIAAQFDTREKAAAYLGRISALLASRPQPPMPPGAESYCGSIVIGRKLTGLEIELVECGVTITLIADGPRTILPVRSLRPSCTSSSRSPVACSMLPLMRSSEAGPPTSQSDRSN